MRITTKTPASNRDNRNGVASSFKDIMNIVPQTGITWYAIANRNILAKINFDDAPKRW